ncbi:MAG: YesL family protein [Clostridiaceae bacterium]|nr:YesL family protein [Clostridiaceae bacterium]
MVWLRPGWLREGPGIDKDAPPKTGLALFFEIFEREFWQILKLNLLFVVCAAPLVTFGPARAALSRCTVNMVRDIPNDVFSDFRRALKQDFRRNAAVGLAELFGIGLLLAAASLPAVQESAALSAGLFAAALLAALPLGYLWPLLAAVDLPVRAAVRNALGLAFACPQHSLPALGVCALLGVLCFGLFPLSLPLMLFVPFGVGSFTTSFAAWSDIRRLVLQNDSNGGI